MCVRLRNTDGIKFSLHLSNIQTTDMPGINKPIWRLRRWKPNRNTSSVFFFRNCIRRYTVSVHYSKCYFQSKIKDCLTARVQFQVFVQNKIKIAKECGCSGSYLILRARFYVSVFYWSLHWTEIHESNSVETIRRSAMVNLTGKCKRNTNYQIIILQLSVF